MRITDFMEPDWNIKREIFFSGGWVVFDACGDDTASSREFYKHMDVIAQGSFPLRYNGVVNPNSEENEIFYKRRR